MVSLEREKAARRADFAGTIEFFSSIGLFGSGVAAYILTKNIYLTDAILLPAAVSIFRANVNSERAKVLRNPAIREDKIEEFNRYERYESGKKVFVTGLYRGPRRKQWAERFLGNTSLV